MQVTVGGVASVQAEFAANMKTSKQTSTVTEEINVVARGWPMNYAAATKDHVQICKNFADSTNTVFGGAVAAELIPYESGVRGWRKMVAQYKQSRLMDTPTQPDFLQAAIAVSDAIQALTECQLRVHFLSGKGKIVTTKLRQRMDFASSQLATLDGTQKLAPYQYFLANKAEPASQEHAKDWEAGHLVAEALNMVIAITKELQNLG